MPDALKKRSGFRGCPRTTRERYCEEHAPLARRFYDRQRGSSTERGYDGAWERVAECRRHMDCGLCQPCLAEGFVTASAIVDHIIPIHVRPDWRLEIGNTQVICHPCHTRKTSEDTRRYGGRARTNPSREQMENRYCWAGLDLPSTQDITALVLVFRDEDQYTALPFFWVPEEGARQRAHRDRVPYQDWIREGYIEATPGSVIDYDRIRAKINELGKQYDILEIAIDRWNATQLATQLSDDGFEMVAFGQGYASMNWPTKKLEEVILAGKLAHGGNPVSLDGRQCVDRNGRRRQLEAVQEEEPRADRRHCGADHGPRPRITARGIPERLRQARAVLHYRGY